MHAYIRTYIHTITYNKNGIIKPVVLYFHTYLNFFMRGKYRKSALCDKGKMTLYLCKKIKIQNNITYKLEEDLVRADPHCRLAWIETT